MKGKVESFGYHTLLEKVTLKNQLEGIFIFDNLNSFVEGLNFNIVINYPVRLSMVVALICKQGHIKVRVGLDDFRVEKNMIMAILPEQIIQLIEISPDFEAGYILLEKNFFDIQNDFKMALNLQSYFFKQPCVRLSEKDMEEGVGIFNFMKGKIEENTSLFLKEIVQSCIRTFFYLICNILMQSNRKTVKTRKEEIFEEFISLLGKNFHRERNIARYAENFYLTPKYFSALVYEVSGKHAGDWVRDYVMLEAKALLNSGTLTIQQIGHELGFANQSHFGTYFKRYAGVSPREYKYGKAE